MEETFMKIHTKLMNILETMKKNKKKTIIVSGISLIVFLISISFIQVMHYKHLVSVEKNLEKKSKNLTHSKIKKSSKRQPANSDEMVVDDLNDSMLAGIIFGPRDLGKYIVKF